MLEILTGAAPSIPRSITSATCITPRDLQAFYRTADPTNSFNPGIGKTSKRKGWAEDPR